MISKRILVKDSGKVPFLTVYPKLDWRLEFGGELEIPFSDFVDPEDETLFITIKLRNAHKFARFDYD